MRASDPHGPRNADTTMTAGTPEPLENDLPPAAVQDLHPLRKPCPCGCLTGRIIRRGGQDVAYCVNCGAYQYCVPKTETGRAAEAVTRRPGIKPKQRARILGRDGNRCVFCGGAAISGVELVIGHLLSVADAIALGVPDEDTYHDENLAAMCPECNSGIGRDSVGARLIAAIIRHRATRDDDSHRESA